MPLNCEKDVKQADEDNTQSNHERDNLLSKIDDLREYLLSIVSSTEE